ncbi:hypothetical protein VP01_11642g1 [Puccinia sorghi]|uniref:Uncharacterized protein n=1 Tax=Puccinia sorghi TaxID=27349 RepID=A0A0L6VSW0_9BASI|nr:hypothetical protein VP01_11642g1 [Puccinia sorghi]
MTDWLVIACRPRAWAGPSRTWLCAKIHGPAKELDQAPWALSQALFALCRAGLEHVRQTGNTISNPVHMSPHSALEAIPPLGPSMAGVKV